MTKRAKPIFMAMLKNVPAEQWSDHLDLACADDEELRSRVEELLAAHIHSESFLEKPAVRMAATLVPATTEAPGTQIGPYTLREQIGEGGMGVVYVAEQEEPIRRKVALKIIKPGMDSKQVVARFEAERQALAIMSHPHIAKVLDGGTTENGRPYFVMELVKGVPITEFCDQRKLDMRERLELFISVCQAVQHAHLKGIIHRDLKPSNVLVELHDVTAVPKVIDFGIAKATNQQLTQQTIYTQLSQLVGTPLYMSPEQAELSGLDVDTRSDVYSLGVLLYELLAGVTPFDESTLSSVGLDEMRRIIREDEPARPSHKVSTLNNELVSTISESRKTDARQLSLTMKQELDWIVMRALEKDRTRRYESASALAADIQRYLDDEAVEACPPSVGYRMRKFARRRKGLLTTAGLVAVTLLVATGVSLSYAVQADRARDDADEEKGKALAAQEKSEQDLATALDAIDKLLQHASSAELTEIPQAQPIRRKILEDVLEFYDQFSVTTGDSPKVRYRAALTWKDLAFLGRELGEYDLAQKAFDETQSRAEMLTQQAPGNVEYQTLLFFAIQDCGQFHLHTLRDFDSAHDYFERGLNQAEKLLVEHPEHADVWMSFEMYSFRGLFQVAGKIQDEEAQRTYAFAARDVAAQLRTISVADAVYAARGMTTVLEKSDPDLAEGYLLEALEKSRPWSQPDAARRDVNARVTLLRHAMGFFEERNRKLATELASEAVELSGRLVTTFPAIRDYGLRFEDVLKWRLQILKQGDGADGSSKELIATYLQKYPKSPAVHRINTELLNESEDPVAALTQAIKAFPEQSVYYATRGMLLAEQHRMDEAIADLNEVFTHSGNGNQLRKQLRIAARGLVDAGRYEDGLALAQLARAQGDEDFNLDVTLCEANRGLERFDEALVHINTAIGKAPEQFSFYKRSALVNFKLDRFDAALAAIRKVHELNPDDFSVLQWWIRIPWVARCPDENYRRGHYRLVQLVFEENPDDLNALLMHAGMLIFEGKLEEARQDYDKAMQLADEGKQQWFRREYARHLIDAELLEEALAFSSEKIEANPENPLGYLNRVSLHIKLQDYASARADLQTALKLNATYFVAKYHAALLAIVAGDQEAYAATCQRLLGDEVAVAALKDSEQPLAAWMAVLGPRALTNFEPAIELARAAMDASPESVLSHQALGGLLLRSGQHADAIPHLRRAIALSSDPLGSVTYSEYLLAMAQHHLGDQTEATAALHRGNELARRELSDKTNPPRWNRKLTLELLRKEAEALVGGNEESRVTTENSGNDRTEPPRTPNRPND